MARTINKRGEEKLVPTSQREIVKEYAKGRRDFKFINADGVDLAGADLTGSSFYCSSLQGADFGDARLTHVQFKAANLSFANFEGAQVNSTDLIGTLFYETSFRDADLTGACLSHSDCQRADFSGAWLNNAGVSRADFRNAKFYKTRLSSVQFADVDVSEFCNSAKLSHVSPSCVDARTVMRSQKHPGLKQFMIDCGVPELFAT